LQAVNKIYVVGIGYKPLDKRARKIVLNSDIILASGRLFEVFKGYEVFEEVKDKVKAINNVDETINFIKSQIEIQSNPPLPPFSKGGHGGIVLLASGDPLFFGIGRRAVKEFGKEAVEILPDLSSLQMAFSRIKEPWDDAFLISLHGGPDPEKRRRLLYGISDIPRLLQKHKKIAILTDRENNPATIAKEILKPLRNQTVVGRSELPHLSLRGSESEPKQSPDRFGTVSAIPKKELASPSARNDGIIMYVCEKLGYPDEKITEGTPAEVAGMSFPEPNVVIIQSTGPATHPSSSLCAVNSAATRGERRDGKGGGEDLVSKIRFGITENEVIHSRGLITKDEVRAVTIHKLRLPQRGVFWDIGAGSGSISIEAARLYPELKIYAIEKDEEQINLIKENKVRFNTANIEIIKGEAPDVLVNFLAPDRVFIGGSGGRLTEIINYISQIPVKIVIINAATIETLNSAIQDLERNGFGVEVSEISISRSKVISNRRHMRALNPVFIITGEKKT
jgi:precorrin-6Y C5,15-methyltransferase (decarboxylating)